MPIHLLDKHVEFEACGGGIIVTSTSGDVTTKQFITLHQAICAHRKLGEVIASYDTKLVAFR